MSLSMRHDGFEDFLVDQLLGQVVVDFLVRQETPRLAHLDERLELLAALGGFLFGERGLVQAELAHQRALLGAADLHAQRLGLGFLLVGNDDDFGLDLDFAFEVGFDVAQVFFLGQRLALLGRRLSCQALALGLGLARRLGLRRRLAALGWAWLRRFRGLAGHLGLGGLGRRVLAAGLAGGGGFGSWPGAAGWRQAAGFLAVMRSLMVARRHAVGRAHHSRQPAPMWRASSRLGARERACRAGKFA
jgi:hypothetical protein